MTFPLCCYLFIIITTFALQRKFLEDILILDYALEKIKIEEKKIEFQT